MELTAAAQGLNAFFFGYDSALLGALHSVAEGVGVVMPKFPKEELFRFVLEKGILPRKAFSMGEAEEKRYYMEAKKIVKD